MGKRDSAAGKRKLFNKYRMDVRGPPAGVHSPSPQELTEPEFAAKQCQGTPLLVHVKEKNKTK